MEGNDRPTHGVARTMNDWDTFSDDDIVADGERFDHPVPKRPVRRGVRTIAAFVLAAMLFAAGTPLSWVTVLTAFLMFLIWVDIGRRPKDDDLI